MTISPNQSPGDTKGKKDEHNLGSGGGRVIKSGAHGAWLSGAGPEMALSQAGQCPHTPLRFLLRIIIGECLQQSCPAFRRRALLVRPVAEGHSLDIGNRDGSTF